MSIDIKQRLKDFWKVYGTLYLIFIVIVFGVGHISEKNGRIEQCTELGYVYRSDGFCVTCEESGRVWENNECVILEQLTTADMIINTQNTKFKNLGVID